MYENILDCLLSSSGLGMRSCGFESEMECSGIGMECSGIGIECFGIGMECSGIEMECSGIGMECSGMGLILGTGSFDFGTDFEI